ncbi:MAG: hypothetical protein O3C57_03055 [Verrucomicrobia bacterium]|nr:hypothetical protein [Verrucomicrobiota bacterium]
MRARFIVVAVLALATITGRAEDLKKLGLDDASSASPKIEVDAKVKVEGTSSLKITTQWPTTVCLGEVTGPDIENAQLVYSAKVKTELEGTGTAFLELWVHVGGGQFFSKGMNDAVSQKSDWKTIQTPFMFQKGQKPDKVTLNLVINGKGTVWIDDIVLSKEPLK